MSDIVILQDRRASNASVVERLALLGLRSAAKLLQPTHFKGYGRVASLLSHVAPERHIILEIDNDCRFRFPFADAYWSRLLEPSVVYEPEMVALFRLVRDVDYGFVDCGANFGYWSILVSGSAFGQHPAIAIEASGTNASELEANSELNSGRYQVVHAAVAEEDGGMVSLQGKTHEGLAIVDRAAAAPDAETVCCVSLDGLMKRSPWFADQERFILKLDVEGVEEAALRGASTLLEHETLLIYEEQGSDETHSNTRFVANVLELPIFVFDGTRFKETADPLSAMDKLKSNRRRGYNIVATKSPDWLERLRNG